VGEEGGENSSAIAAWRTHTWRYLVFPFQHWTVLDIVHNTVVYESHKQDSSKSMFTCLLQSAIAAIWTSFESPPWCLAAGLAIGFLHLPP
jgi:hypothetical protein